MDDPIEPKPQQENNTGVPYPSLAYICVLGSHPLYAHNFVCTLRPKFLPEAINNTNLQKANLKMMSEPVQLNMIMDNQDGDDGDQDRSVSSSSFTGASASKSGHDHDATEDEAEKEMRDKIIKKEEKGVRRGRIIVVAAYIACATAVSVMIYTFASRADLRNFELEVRRWLVC